VINFTPWPLTPPPFRRIGHGTHFIRSWVGPTNGLDGCGKSPPTGFDPRTIQPVASRYIDYAIPATDSFNSDYQEVNLQRGVSQLPVQRVKTAGKFHPPSPTALEQLDTCPATRSSQLPARLNLWYFIHHINSLKKVVRFQYCRQQFYKI